MGEIITGIYMGICKRRIEYPKNEKTEKQTRLHKELQEKAETKDLCNDFLEMVMFNHCDKWFAVYKRVGKGGYA